MPIRVLIVDDHLVVRAGLTTILGAALDIEVVGEAADGREAVARYAALRPDAVLMDLRMPGMDGVAAITAIRRDDPAARVVVLTMYEGDVDIHRALTAGAIGYLLKDTPAADLFAAVRSAAVGRRALPAAVALALAEYTPRIDLTEREVEVLRLVALALSNAEIAERLVLTEATVKTHVSSILRKLGLRDRVQAVVYAYETGLSRPGQS